MGFAKLEAGLKAARERHEREFDERPVRCPYDGARLQQHPDDPDVLHCPMGNYTWRGELGVGRDGLGVRGA